MLFRSINELISQITNQVGWYYQPHYSYMVEDDDGLETESENISFATRKRINDAIEIGGKVAAFNSFRDGLWEYRRQLGLHTVIQTFPGFTIRSDAQIDVLSGEMDILRFQGNLHGSGKWSWIQSKILYENVLYELWSGTRANGTWGELAMSWPSYFKLTAGAGRWNLSDDNKKIQASLNLDIQVLGKEGFSFFLNSRYLDFQENVIGYWTPQQLRYDGGGILIERRLGSKTNLSAYGEYAINSDQERFLRLNGSVGFDLTDSYSISSGISYFETDTAYRMLLWNVSILAGSWF